MMKGLGGLENCRWCGELPCQYCRASGSADWDDLPWLTAGGGIVVDVCEGEGESGDGG